MKKLSWLFACVFSLAVSAQEKLVIMGKFPDQYVVHTISGEESLQTISNQFGQSVTRLSTYNGLAAGAVLSKGAQIKIPLSQYNMVHTKVENSAPVYHLVEKGDNLYRLSKINNIALATLKEWNSLKTDIVKDGQLLIIGYMLNAHIAEDKKVADVNASEYKPVRPSAPAEKYLEKKEAVVPLTKATSVVIKPIVGKVTDPSPKEVLPTTYVPKEGDEGYFSIPYSQHAKELSQQFHSGDASTFKTISGWTDHKYYILINDVAPETIVRITAPNNKSVCAKVLGPLQETKGGNGLLLRMSNSAAATLGFTDTKFTVTVTYFE